MADESIWAKFVALLPYIIPFVTLLIGVYKDSIIRKFTKKKAAGEAELTTADTIDKNLKLYQRLLDDYKERKELEDKEQRHRISQLEGRVQQIGEENQRLLKKVAHIDEENERLRNENKEIRQEKNDLQETLFGLKEQVKKLKNIVEKLEKQIAFYRQHSDLELPDDLEQ